MAGIISRVIGMLYRIPLMNIIGEAGSGVYSTAYDIYNIMLLISSYSLPMAVSKLISAKLSMKEYRNVRQIFAVSLLFGSALGLMAALLMFLGASFFAADLMNMPRAVLAIKILSPTVFIMGMLGVIRGYFQGHGTMVPTAVSQILEQIVHVIVSLVAAKILFNKGVELEMEAQSAAVSAPAYGAAGATIGTGVGALTALFFVGFCLFLYQKTANKRVARDISGRLDTPSHTLKVVFLTALPILISATISNLVSLMDHAVFGAYMGAEAMEEYESIWGAYSGKYIVLTNVPIAVATALSASTLPVISSHMAIGERDEALKKSASAIRVIALISIPATLLLTFLGKPSLDLLFRSSDNSLAGSLMLAGSLSIIGYSLSAICVGILQGSGFFWEPIKNYIIAILIHVPLLLMGLFVFRVGIIWVSIANAAFSLSAAGLNLLSMHRRINYRQEWRRSFGKVTLASLIALVIALGVYYGLSFITAANAPRLIIGFLTSFAVYLAAVIKLDAVNGEELITLPKGRLLYKLAVKGRLISEDLS